MSLFLIVFLVTPHDSGGSAKEGDERESGRKRKRRIFFLRA